MLEVTEETANLICWVRAMVKNALDIVGDVRRTKLLHTTAEEGRRTNVSGAEKKNSQKGSTQKALRRLSRMTKAH